MGRPRRIVLGRRWITAAAITGLAYAVLASLTHPFTWAAEIITAVALVGVPLVGVAFLATARAGDTHRPARWDGPWIAWSVPILATLVITGWELYCFASLPRVQHPTLSSLLDILDATRVGKTVAFSSWLALGWFLVAR